MNARVTGRRSNSGGSSASGKSAGMRLGGNMGRGSECDTPSEEVDEEVRRDMRGRVELN